MKLSQGFLAAFYLCIVVAILCLKTSSKETAHAASPSAPRHSKIEWRETPGCFERHLQRRCDNPLFPEERRKISSDELTQARTKDDNDQKEFAKRCGIFFSEANHLNETSPADDLTKYLQDAQRLLELASAIGGNLEKEVNLLEALESKLIDLLNSKLPQGADLLKKAHSLSVMDRIPFLAQSQRPGSPILKSEELQSILSHQFNNEVQHLEQLKASAL